MTLGRRDVEFVQRSLGSVPPAALFVGLPGKFPFRAVSLGAYTSRNQVSAAGIESTQCLPL